MRNNLIDFIRGVAFLLMLIHHYYHFNPNSVEMPEIVSNLGILSRTLFIILVGVSMRIFSKDKDKDLKFKDKIAINGPYKKSYIIILCGLIVSFATYLLLPNSKIIFFGVLHFIGIVTILMKGVSSNLYLSVLFGIISLLITEYMKTKEGSNNIFHLIIGGYTQTRNPLDIFPIFQWIPYVSFGIVLGEFLKKSNIDESVFKPIEYCGRNSLYLYLLHVIPCIYWYSTKFNLE